MIKLVNGEIKDLSLYGILCRNKAIENTNAAYLSDWQHRVIAIPCDEEEYCRELAKRIP